MVARVVVFAALALGMFACTRAVDAQPAPAPMVSPASPEPPPLATAPPPPPREPSLPPGVMDHDVDDVREATFRHLFKKNASGQQQHAKVFCLEVENAAPAAVAFIARFRDSKVLVKPVSECDAADMHVVDRATGGKGLIFRVNRVIMTDAEHATVGGGYYEGGLSASGNTFTLEKKDGHWIVTRDVMNWIS